MLLDSYPYDSLKSLVGDGDPFAHFFCSTNRFFCSTNRFFCSTCRFLFFCSIYRFFRRATAGKSEYHYKDNEQRQAFPIHLRPPPVAYRPHCTLALYPVALSRGTGKRACKRQPPASQFPFSLTTHGVLQLTIDPDPGLDGITFTPSHSCFTEITLDPRLAHGKLRGLGFD